MSWMDGKKINEYPWGQDAKNYPKLPSIPEPAYTPAGYPDIIDWETLEEIKKANKKAMEDAKSKKMAAYYEKLAAMAAKEAAEKKAKKAKAKKKRKARKKKVTPPPVHDDNLYEREV